MGKLYSHCDRSKFIHLIDGTRSDREVADLAGVSVGQVVRARLAIKAPTRRRNWDNYPLGTAPDSYFAKLIGVNEKTVAVARWVRGIPPWREFRLCPCGEEFLAVHMRQRHCSKDCYCWFWQLVNIKGNAPDVARCYVALRALKKTIKKGGVSTHVE